MYLIKILYMHKHVRMYVYMYRWSRTPRDNRLCVCGQIQTEEHIICECIVSADIRHMYPNVTFRPLQMFFSHSDLTELCTVTALISEKFQ